MKSDAESRNNIESPEVIRDFLYPDADAVSDLIRRALSEINIKDYSPEVISFMVNYFNTETIIKNSKDKKTFVLVDGQRILGTGSVKDGEISEVFVDPTSISTGIGTKLMNKMEEFIRNSGYGSVYLFSSLTAVGFYKKRGYKIVGENESKDFGKTIKMSKDFI